MKKKYLSSWLGPFSSKGFIIQVTDVKVNYIIYKKIILFVSSEKSAQSDFSLDAQF